MAFLGRFGNQLTLNQPINKAKVGNENLEGVVTPLEDEFTLKISDQELIDLKNQWEKEWSTYNGKIKAKQTKNTDYYLGKQFGITDLLEEGNPPSDNMIFEAVETSIPQYTSENPEPIVLADGTPEGDKLAGQVKRILISKADTQHIKLKMKKAVRQWHLNYIGVFFIEWDENKKDFNTVVERPGKIGMDPEGIIDGAEFIGEWVFRLKKNSAKKMVELFPDKKTLITSMVDGKMGTRIQYKEWWTDEYVFWSLNNIILDKAKNPNWNPEKDEVLTDRFGFQGLETVPGDNHFQAPRKPFVFISVFSMDSQPHDETSLVEQNRSTQDLINNRIRQIDKNIDSMNGGWVISGDGFTKEQAGDVATTLSMPSAYIWVPTGAPQNSVARLQPTGLPADAYNQLDRHKQALLSNFGTTGFTPQGTASEEAVRGKILVRGQDQNRATTISEALEQSYDAIYNWWIQMMYVYYEEAQTIPVLGRAKGTEVLTIQSKDFTTQLEASVKPGSMIPKDPLTMANQAIDLYGMGAMDPISLFEALDYPDPTESAKQLFMWQSNPASLFPDLAQQAPAGLPPEALAGGEGSAPVPQDNEGLALPVDSPDLLSNIPIQ